MLIVLQFRSPSTPQLTSMVHFCVLNPVRKLRLLSSLFYRGSKRILRKVYGPPALSNTHTKANTASTFDIAVQRSRLLKSELIEDAVYYKHSDTGYCVFQIENTLFKVIILPFKIYSSPHFTLKSFIVCFLPENLLLSVICSLSLNPTAQAPMTLASIPLYSCPTLWSSFVTFYGHCTHREYILLAI